MKNLQRLCEPGRWPAWGTSRVLQLSGPVAVEMEDVFGLVCEFVR